jgi:uncharacterized protein (TIGR03000 family)
MALAVTRTQLCLLAAAVLTLIPWLPARAGPPADKKPAVVNIIVPPDAELVVEEYKTQTKGETRAFESPPLTPGKDYSYTIKATWKGKTLTRKITIRAGQETTADLRDDLQALAAKNTDENPPKAPPKAEPKTEPTVSAPKMEPKAEPSATTPKVEPKTEPTVSAPKTELPVPAPKTEPKSEPTVSAPKVEPRTEPAVNQPKAEPKAEPTLSLPKAEPKTEPSASAPKAEPKTEPAVSEPKVEPKAEPKTEPTVSAQNPEPKSEPDAATPKAEPKTEPSVSAPKAEPKTEPGLELMLPENVVLAPGETQYTEVRLRSPQPLEGEPAVTLQGPGGDGKVILELWTASTLKPDSTASTRGYAIRAAADAPEGDKEVKVSVTAGSLKTEGKLKITVKKPPPAT